MTERDSYPAGTPSWVDLGSPDVEASAAFYSALFGWNVEEPGGPESGGYRMATIDGKPVAGLGPAQAEGVPPWWTTYVTVDSADDAAKAVEEAGGTVLAPPFDVMDAGRMAAFKDPGGAVFSVWEPKEHIGARLVNEPGTLTWNELETRDMDRAKAFYAKVLGWESEDQPMGEDYTYTLWRVPSVENSVGGATPPMGDQSDQPDLWRVYFAVADCDTSVAKVQELGGTVLAPPMDIPEVGRFAMCAGPHGELFAVIANPPASGDQPS